MGVLADALMAKGYNQTDALNAERLDDGRLAQEYLGGGSSSGSTSSNPMSGFTFDQAAAEKAAMEELRPYYEKLLTIYNGDVNLAKKRMEEDYARGLRYKAESTATGMGDIADTRAERDRKFKLALGDLDQEMNTRGLTTSGIKTGAIQQATADEAYQKSLLDKQARDLATSEKQYIEGANVDKQRFLEEKGFAPTGVAGYMSEPEKQKWEQAQKMTTQSRSMALDKRTQAATDYAAATTPLVTAQPQNYTDLLNKAMKMQGLPTIG